MKVDMHLYDFTKHDYSDIVDLFIYLFIYLVILIHVLRRFILLKIFLKER